MTRSARIAIGVLSVAGVLSAATAEAQTGTSPAPSPGSQSQLAEPPRGPVLSEERTHLLVDRQGIAEQVDLGCRARVTLTVEAGTYVICEDLRLLHVQTANTPATIAQIPVDGEPVDLWDRGGQAWVEVIHRQAHSVGGQSATPLPPSGATAPTAVPTAAPSPVPWVQPGTPAPAPQAADSELPSAVWIPPPRGARVSIWSPSRVGGWELDVGARPFMGDGAGLLGRLALQYRGESRHFVLRLDLDPLGGAVGDGENPWITGAMFLAGFDHPMFEIGLGVGGSRVFVDKGDRFAAGLAATVRQSIRIGARDGVYLHVHNTFTWIDSSIDGADSSIDWAGVYTALQIPLGEKTWLIFRGEGGESLRYAWGEIALRLLLKGTREKGLFLAPSLGGAAIFTEPGEFGDNQAHSGPMIGIDAEIRF